MCRAETLQCPQVRVLYAPRWCSQALYPWLFWLITFKYTVVVLTYHIQAHSGYLHASHGYAKIGEGYVVKGENTCLTAAEISTLEDSIVSFYRREDESRNMFPQHCSRMIKYQPTLHWLYPLLLRPGSVTRFRDQVLWPGSVTRPDQALSCDWLHFTASGWIMKQCMNIHFYHFARRGGLWRHNVVRVGRPCAAMPRDGGLSTRCRLSCRVVID